MKIEQQHIDQIQKQFAEMQSKEDLVKLLSAAKNMLYSEKCKPVQLKSLTYYRQSRNLQKTLPDLYHQEKVRCRQNHQCTRKRVEIYFTLIEFCVAEYLRTP